MVLTFSNLDADSFETETQRKAGRKGPRHRDTVSCWPCRTRKRRCDRGQPCQSCQDRGILAKCTYEGPKHSKQSLQMTKHSKETVGCFELVGDNGPPASETPARLEWPDFLENPGSDIFQTSKLKTRLVGKTHWMAPCNDMDVVKAMLNRSDGFQSSRQAFRELKARMRTDNAISSLMPLSTADGAPLYRLLPGRQACEGWIAAYCQTYGRIYNVVDPSALAADLDQVFTGLTTANTVHLFRVLLAIAIGMQNVESERLQGRRIAKGVEEFVHSSLRFQKPCVGVVQVLLLLMIMKNISVSDTDKLYGVLGIQGLTAQVVSSMGLHRDPSLFTNISPYHAEVRKRLWGCFLRLSLDHCLRSGTQLTVRLEDCDCPLPAQARLRDLDPSRSPHSTSCETEKRSQADAAFGSMAVRLAQTIVPVHQALCSPNPHISVEMQTDLRTGFRTLLEEVPSHLRPGSVILDPIEQLQQSLMLINMHSVMMIVSLGFILGTPSTISQRGYLLEIWDDAISVLQHFQHLCQGSQESSTMAYHLCWADACRAAFSACLVVGRLRSLDLGRTISTRPKHSVCIFQQLLTNHLTFLCQLWQGKFHLGPVAAKTGLLLEVCTAVTSNLFTNSDGTYMRQKLFNAGIGAAAKSIADMQLVIEQRRALSCTGLPAAPASLASDVPSSDISTWATEGSTGTSDDLVVPELTNPHDPVKESLVVDFSVEFDSPCPFAGYDLLTEYETRDLAATDALRDATSISPFF